MRNGLFIYESPETMGAEVTICSRRLAPAGSGHWEKVQARKGRYNQRARRARIRCKVNFVICITDASRVDRQIVVSVAEPTNLGRAAHLALDQIMDEGAKIQFPVFLDIHSADEFSNVAWMHGQ